MYNLTQQILPVMLSKSMYKLKWSNMNIIALNFTVIIKKNWNYTNTLEFIIY